MRADSLVYPLGTAVASGAAGAAVAIRGGEYLFCADGTVGGATVSLQIQLPDATWCDVGAVGGNAIVKTTTLPVAVSPVLLPAGNVRVNVLAGTSSSVNAWLAGIG